jgi:hypothetical protein
MLYTLTKCEDAIAVKWRSPVSGLVCHRVLSALNTECLKY